MSTERTPEEIQAQISELQKELETAENAKRIREGRTQALADIAAISAFKVLFARLKATEGLLSQVWHDIPGPSLPREGLLARKYDISETEVSNASKKGREAVKEI